MDNTQYVINTVRKDIIDNNLKVKAIIQDINNCQGPLSVLEELNNAGRQKIASLRKHIEHLNELVSECNDEELDNEIDTHRKQLTSTLAAFRKANMNAMLTIEKANSTDLFDTNKDEDTSSTVRKRTAANAGKAGLLKVSSNVTDQLLSISRQLADTTQRSADTLDSLVSSSSSVQGTNDELINTKGTIGQSEKLLAKYGRREFTDKVLLFFAFSFFLACVLYIVQKRLL
ncbi:vesicle transport protein SEC20 [Chrysoperla carnea]|uniref:vesicle transport protein SEC20 n=1 Tax=Chrysoperla carnea TaxID=189513 RepID=UPI001D07610B|nr:vesicle transport protein SEC20 [Chrysoperla carnea]